MTVTYDCQNAEKRKSQHLYGSNVEIECVELWSWFCLFGARLHLVLIVAVSGNRVTTDLRRSSYPMTPAEFRVNDTMPTHRYSLLLIYRPRSDVCSFFYSYVYAQLVNAEICSEAAIDYRCEDGRFPVSTICVTISNPGSLSRSETGGYPWIKRWKISLVWTSLSEARKPLVVPISLRSGELLLYNLVWNMTISNLVLIPVSSNASPRWTVRFRCFVLFCFVFCFFFLFFFGGGVMIGVF
jgi:hypothetical protein